LSRIEILAGGSFSEMPAFRQPPPACSTRHRRYAGLMNRRLLLVVVIVALVSASAGRELYRKRRAAGNYAAVDAAFLKYFPESQAGVTRKEVKDYIRDQGLAFVERCCYAPAAPFSVLVRVGEEDSPWYCSEWPGYVEFEFVISQPSDLTAKPSDSELLDKVQLTSNGEGCL
jgi:hypothetical protein